MSFLSRLGFISRGLRTDTTNRPPRLLLRSLLQVELLERREALDATMWAIGNGNYDLSQTLLLHSRPSSTRVIFLDFDGHSTVGAGTPWGDVISPAWDPSGNGPSFTAFEQQTIQKIWARVAEDYAPFDVDVTTQDPGVANLIKSNASDTHYGKRVVITPDDSPAPGAGGVAFVGSFDWNTDTPAYVFNSTEKPIAEAASHEAGHTVGLSHDGTSTSEYYSGQGTGTLSWGPIMGAAYNPNVTQWSRGEYPDANNQEDDLQIITTQNGFGYRTDDFGNTQAAATSLLAQGASTVSPTYGVIERNTDADYFSFWSNPGAISLAADPMPLGPNLAIRADLYNASGTLLQTFNPANALNAQVNYTITVGGQYFLKLSGTGKGNVATTGFSNYASLGNYRISGTVVAYVPTNSPPVANPDAATTPMGTPDNISVLANDTDANGDTLTITSVTAATSGTAAISGSSILYTPAANFTGTSTFTYFISDGHGGTASALVTVTVMPPNIPPVANNDTATTTTGTPVTINVLANDTDANGDTLTITGVFGALNGAPTISGSSVIFVPTAGFNGAGSFQYSISDGHGGTAAATVTVTIAPPNVPPVANADSAWTTTGTPVTINVLANDTDANGDTLTIVSVGNASHGVATISGSSVIFTPTAGFNGSGTFTYSISDGHGGTAAALVTVTVSAPNVAPVANPDTALTTTGTAVTISVLANDTDANGDALTITGVSGAVNGSAAISGSAVIFTPTAGFNGTGSFTYSISDAHGGTASASVTVTIVPPNVAPVANPDTASTTTGTAVTISVLANDTDANGDTLTITGVSGAQHGVAVITGTAVVFTPTAGFSGMGSFTYSISDGHGGTASASATVVITAPNVAPVAVADTAATVVNTRVAIGVLANDTDANGDVLTIASVSNAQNGSATISGRTVVFTPAAGFLGTGSFTYTISDGHGGTASATATVIVNPFRNTQNYSNNTAAAIGAVSTPTVTSAIVVAGAVGVVQDVDVTVNIDHTNVSDLQITLIAPNGTRIVLFDHYGGSGANIRARFDDSAAVAISAAAAPYTGSFRPTDLLAGLNGRAPNGAWQLEIVDNATGGGGQLNGWSLALTTGIAVSPAPAAPVPAAPAPTVRGSTADPVADSLTRALSDLQVRTLFDDVLNRQGGGR